MLRIIIYIILIVISFICHKFILSTVNSNPNSDLLKEINLAGTIASIVGIVIIYFELFATKKRITNIYNLTNNIRKNLTHDDFIYEVENTLSLTRNIRDNITDEKLELSLILFEFYHEKLIKIKKYCELNNIYLDIEIHNIISNISPFMRAIRNKINDTTLSYSKSKILLDLDEIVQKLIEFKLKINIHNE